LITFKLQINMKFIKLLIYRYLHYQVKNITIIKGYHFMSVCHFSS